MASIEVDVPPDVEMKIARLIESDEFETQEQAIEQLLSMGIRAYQTNGDDREDEMGFNDEFQDDFDDMGHDDEYVF